MTILVIDDPPSLESSERGYFDDRGDPRRYFVYRLSHAEIEAHGGRNKVPNRKK